MTESVSINTFDPVQTKADEEAMRRGYVFDRKLANRPVKFIEKNVVLTAGDFAGKPFRLLLWQKIILWMIFGWVHGETGARRFREVLVVVPKKNGKTGLWAALLLYLLRSDGEVRPKIHLVAVDSEQAKLTYEEAAEHVAQSPNLKDEFECSEFYKRLRCDATGGEAVVRSAEADNKDGSNLSAVMIDEVHLLTGRRRKVWRVYAGAGATRSRFLRLAISTAGHDRTSVLFEQVKRAWRIEDGESTEDIHFFGKVYGPRDGEAVDPHDEATWFRYNPSLGVTLPLDLFRADYLAAKNSPADFEDFKQRRLNIWGQPTRKFVDLDAWKRCPPRRPLADILASGEPWFAGWDLASTRDLTAWVDVCGTLATGLDVFVKVWLPRKTAEERFKRDGLPYLEWADAGWIELVDEDVLDHQRVIDHAVERYRAVPYRMAYGDFFGAKRFHGELEIAKVPHKIIHQNFGAISSPTKELDRLVSAGLLRHADPEKGENPVLTWAASNAVTIKDSYDNIRIDRDKSSDKIDPMAALVNSVAGVIDDMVERAKAPKPVDNGKIMLIKR